MPLQLPAIVELAGLAGSGKTTLARALIQSERAIMTGGDLELRKVRQIPLFVAQVPSLLQVLLPPSHSGESFSWDEVKAMAYLKAWPAVLRQQASRHSTAILVDQGPMFKLATLHAFGPERMRDGSREQWWDRVLGQWADTLDLVIWLTAPVEVLIERIQGRSKHHEIKDKSELEAREFLARYQASYEYILAEFAARNGPTVIAIDTSQTAAEQALHDIWVALDLVCAQGRHAADGRAQLGRPAVHSE